MRSAYSANLWNYSQIFDNSSLSALIVNISEIFCYFCVMVSNSLSIYLCIWLILTMFSPTRCLQFYKSASWDAITFFKSALVGLSFNFFVLSVLNTSIHLLNSYLLVIFENCLIISSFSAVIISISCLLTLSLMSARSSRSASWVTHLLTWLSSS